ncbi:MAG: transcription initiation protein [Cytophagaceae bacterium]|nr:transcription initiation protein [Cytophagaceae bacterium]MBK9934633.1 transcription initiation protein [Cytophagaceae bacterium]MBL0301072.1 transcription initiation protein [Cytophagaceae bacterium]MBL0323889.1 transcription initiation protein [Cytophagaceae bacterium]
MNEYILIFRHENATGKVSPEQMQQWMQQQMEWVNSIVAQNKFVSGTGLLFDNAKVVHHDKTVTNGPFGELKETLGGYVIVKAESAEEAAEFAKGTPILQGEGNTVEVRQIITH